MNYDLLWSKVLEDVRTMVNEIIYSTWFATAKLYKIENNEATIIVPTEIHRSRLQNVYFQELTNSFFKETNDELANFTDSKANYINLGCENNRVSEKEAIQALYNMTLVLRTDKEKLTTPQF